MTRLESLLYVIITGAISTIIFEIGKFLFLFIVDKIKEKSVSFSISGYWCSYNSEYSFSENKIYSAYELVKINYSKEKIVMHLYQLTNDNRRHQYKGYGFLRGNKLVISYEEANCSTSNHIGAFILKMQNKNEHSILFAGNYYEYRGEADTCEDFKYILKPCTLSLSNRLLIFIFRNKYIYKLISKEEFKNECQKDM